MKDFTQDQILDLAIHAAGLEADEFRHDPEHGLLISASGCRKMAAMSRSPGLIKHFYEMADRLEREGAPQ